MSTVSQLAGHQYLFEPGTAAAGPVLLLLHGTGGTERDLLPLAAKVASGAPVVSPRGNVLENGMPRYFRRLAEGVFDLEDLAARTAQLAQFIREAAALHEFGLERLVAVGFSNGANIAASVMLTAPDALRHGILLRAMVPFEPARPPALSGSSALISAGKTDPIIPPRTSERLAEMMREAGASVELRWQEAGHALVQGDVTDAQSYLRTWRDG
ncbi:MAG: alpha/beta hydrolase [Gemmatimonadaceae bacterium]